jgi:hypothetical protein
LKKRLLYGATVITYLALLVAITLLWLRSYWALDQLYGSALGRGFDANSFNGQCQIRVTTQYRVRAGLYPNGAIEDYPRPFDVLERDMTFDNPSHVVRQRWPLKETSYWEPDPVRLPRPDYRRWLAFARMGPGRYTWVDLVIVPYWLVIVVAAAPLLAFIPGAIRRCRRRRAGLCARCGYDLRATPGRCPECGMEARPAQPPPVRGR